MSAQVDEAIRRELRAKTIGGGDAAAAVGLSPYCSPLQLWEEKTGRVQPQDFSDNDYVRFGILLEEIVANEFARRNNVKLRRVNQTLVHPKHAHMTGHIDRRVIGAKQGVEAKTAGLRMAKEFGEENTDSVPVQYLIQCQHYLAITGWEVWHLPVLIAGNDYRSYAVRRDEELIETLIERELEFYEHLRADTPPDPITLEDAARRWPLSKLDYVIASEQTCADCLTLSQLRRAIAKLQAEADEKELAIKRAMGEAGTLIANGHVKLATWNHQESTRVDIKRLRAEHPEIASECVKTTNSRVFRLK